MHPFPPPALFPQTRHEVLWIGLTMVVLVFGTFAGLLLRPSRKPHLKDLFIWSAVGIGMTGIVISVPIQVPGIHLVRESLLLMTSTMVVWGVFCSLMKLKARDSRKDEPLGSPANIAVITAVASILLALSMPPQFPGFGERSRDQCGDNLHVIGLAFHHHLEDSGAFPHQASGEPPASWRVNMLPYLDQQNIHAGYDFTAAWDSPANLAVARQDVPVYTCPTAPRESQQRDGLRFTSYVLAVGAHTIWPDAGPLGLDDIKDGSSHTLLVIEACGQHIIWTEPRDLEIDTTPIGVNLPGHNSDESSGLASSYHPGGAFATFADGSVRFLSEEIDPQVLNALLTADGGDDVKDF